MSAQPIWSPIDDPTADLLSAVAEPHPIIGADVSDLFLAACRRDAMANGGFVSVNRVRALLSDEQIEHHRYSSMWSNFTGRNRPMRKASLEDTLHPWETCEGSTTGNNGRPYMLRVWVGEQS